MTEIPSGTNHFILVAAVVTSADVTLARAVR